MVKFSSTPLIYGDIAVLKTAIVEPKLFIEEEKPWALKWFNPKELSMIQQAELETRILS